jgi:hypothetical protein
VGVCVCVCVCMRMKAARQALTVDQTLDIVTLHHTASVGIWYKQASDPPA